MPETDLELLLRGVQAAEPFAIKHFKADPKVWNKSGGLGPVSEADLAIDEELNRIFTKARPDYGWLSEETDDDPARLEHDRVFIVDPIDGTRAFISGQENFAIAVAVAEKGRVTASVVHMPAKGVTYAAELGKGATKNGEPIGVSQCKGLNTRCRVLAAAPVFHAGNWAQKPGVERHFRTSLAYRICLVAEGRFDAALAMRRTWEWDIAAGDLIAREAGAMCTNSEGQDLIYNSPSAAQNGMFAANPALHASLMKHRFG